MDDAEFLGDWGFMHKGRLQELLKEIIGEESDKEAHGGAADVGRRPHG